MLSTAPARPATASECGHRTRSPLRSDGRPAMPPPDRCSLRSPASGGRRTLLPPPSGPPAPDCLALAVSDSGPEWPGSAPASGRTQPGSVGRLHTRPLTVRLPRYSGGAELRPPVLVGPPLQCITTRDAWPDGLL